MGSHFQVPCVAGSLWSGQGDASFAWKDWVHVTCPGVLSVLVYSLVWSQCLDLLKGKKQTDQWPFQEPKLEVPTIFLRPLNIHWTDVTDADLLRVCFWFPASPARRSMCPRRPHREHWPLGPNLDRANVGKNKKSLESLEFLEFRRNLGASQLVNGMYSEHMYICIRYIYI